MRRSVVVPLMGALALLAVLSGLPGVSGATEMEDEEAGREAEAGAGAEAGVGGARGGGGVGLEYDDDYDAAGAQDDGAGASGLGDSDGDDTVAQDMTAGFAQGMDASSFGSTGTDAAAAEEEPAADSIDSLEAANAQAEIAKEQAAAAQKAGRLLNTGIRSTLNRRIQTALLCCESVCVFKSRLGCVSIPR